MKDGLDNRRANGVGGVEMADRDSMTVAALVSKLSAHGTKAVGGDDEDGLDNGRGTEVGGVAMADRDSMKVVGRCPSLAHLARKQPT